MALLALKNTYHKNIIANGPQVIRALQKGKEIIVDFGNSKNLRTRDNGKLIGFEVMNEKGEILLPKAEIKNNEVVLTLNKEDKIIKVLYAYHPFTRANLENEADLPASTFSIEVKDSIVLPRQNK